MNKWRVFYGTNKPEEARWDSEHETVEGATERGAELVRANHAFQVLLLKEEVSRSPSGVILRWAEAIQEVVAQPVASGISEQQVEWLRNVPEKRAEI